MPSYYGNSAIDHPMPAYPPYHSMYQTPESGVFGTLTTPAQNPINIGPRHSSQSTPNQIRYFHQRTYLPPEIGRSPPRSPFFVYGNTFWLHPHEYPEALAAAGHPLYPEQTPKDVTARPTP
jgi:hypothetical protein